MFTNAMNNRSLVLKILELGFTSPPDTDEIFEIARQAGGCRLAEWAKSQNAENGKDFRSVLEFFMEYYSH